MKNTKENIIKLLKSMQDTSWNLVKAFDERGNKEASSQYMCQYMAYERAIYLIEDENAFNEYWNIYFGKGE